MNVTKVRCDHCGREVDDRYSEDGWVQIIGAVSGREKVYVGMYSGQGNDSEASPVVQKTSKDGFDFCDVTCFGHWVRDLVREKDAAVEAWKAEKKIRR